MTPPPMMRKSQVKAPETGQPSSFGKRPKFYGLVASRFLASSFCPVIAANYGVFKEPAIRLGAASGSPSVCSIFAP